MAKLSEFEDGSAALFDNGDIMMPYKEGDESFQKKRFKEYQRELIQMYVDSELKNNMGVADVENYLYRIAPGFSHIAIEPDLEGNIRHRAVWKDEKESK